MQHCILVRTKYVDNVASLRVVAGLHNRTKDLGVIYSVEQVIQHPNYTGMSTQWDSDIALLKVTPPIAFTDFIAPVCLSKLPVKSGVMGVATGWGSTKTNGNQAGKG